MSLIRLVLYFIIGYFLYKLAKAVMQVFSNKQDKVDSSMNTNYTKGKSNKSRIDKKDIIEADFEEIDNKKEN